jgi:hypothetical protein
VFQLQQGVVVGQRTFENQHESEIEDVVLKEDHSSMRTNGAATLMAIVRNLAITLFRRAGYSSITTAIDHFGNDLEKLLPMLTPIFTNTIFLKL